LLDNIGMERDRKAIVRRKHLRSVGMNGAYCILLMLCKFFFCGMCDLN